MPNVHVVAGAAAARATMGAPTPVIEVVGGGGLRLSDSVALTLVRGARRERDFRIDPSTLRWFLSQEGAALAAWLTLLYLLYRG